LSTSYTAASFEREGAPEVRAQREGVHAEVAVLERPDEDVPHLVAVKHGEDGVGVLGRVEQLEVAAAALELGRRPAAAPETLVVVPAEDRRQARRAADAAVVRVRVARCLGEDGAVDGVRAQPFHGRAVAGRVALHPREPVHAVHGAGPLPPEENGRERVGEEACRADEKGGADDAARAARRERERQEERAADHEERPRPHERLEDRVHPPELVAVRVRHEDDVRHGREDRARGGEEEAGAEGAGRGAAASSPAGSRRSSQRTPAANPAARPKTGRFVRTASASPSAGNAVAATSARSSRVCERTSATPNASAGTTRGRRSGGTPRPEVVASFQNVSPWTAGRGDRRNGKRNGTARRSEKRLRTTAGGRALHEVARGEDEEARREVPRVRREDGREEDAVEERPGDRPDAAREAGERDEERERDGVRVEVPEAEREERPLRDRVLDAARGRPPVEIASGLSPRACRAPSNVPPRTRTAPARTRERRPPPRVRTAPYAASAARAGRSEAIRLYAYSDGTRAARAGSAKRYVPKW
jgi:hypothetical protein